MKQIQKSAFIVLLLLCCSSAFTQEKISTAVANQTPLAGGTYFIINNDLALTPVDAGPGQNVFLKPFNRCGLQQWIITRTGSGNTISYTIRLAGEVDGLWLQGYPVKDHTPVIGTRSGNISYRIVPVPDQPGYWYIKSLRYNDDALHAFLFSKELPMELRFDPAENGSKYLWQFEEVNNQ